MYSPADYSRVPKASIRLFLAGGVALAVMALALVFFCPRFYLWQAIRIEEGGVFPEVSRAQVVLAQLRNPYVAVAGATHHVVQWRLLLPVLGHFLHLPPRVFLALPWAGAWLCLAWVFGHARSRMGSAWGAAFTTLLLATFSWFFVATGWLSYNDSWLVLALCLYAFSPNPFLRVAVCLTILWVDERFLFQVPLLAALRHAHFGRTSAQWRLTAKEVALESLALSPYVVLRLCFLAAGLDPEGRDHLARHLSGRDPAQVLRGLWEGLRLGWVALALGAFAMRRRARLLLALGGLAAVAVAANVLVAHDVSRVVSVLAPLVLAACLALAWAYGAWGLRLVAALAVCNLLLPASDVIEKSGGGPIAPVWREWQEYQRMGKAMADAAEGHKAYQAGEYPRAIGLLTRALAAEGSFVDARRGLAWCFFYQGQFAYALEQETIVTGGPMAKPDDWLLRGLCESKLNRFEEARRSLTRVLKTGNPLDPRIKAVAESVLSGLPSVAPPRGGQQP